MYVLTGVKVERVGSSRLVLHQLDLVVEGSSDEHLMSVLTERLSTIYQLALAAGQTPFTNLALAKPPSMERFSEEERDDFRVLVLGHAIIDAIGVALGFRTDDPLYAYWNPRPTQ